MNCKCEKYECVVEGGRTQTFDNTTKRAVQLVKSDTDYCIRDEPLAPPSHLRTDEILWDEY